MKSLAIGLCLVCLFGLSGITASAGLADGLVLYYPFDSNEGAVVTDQSSCGNNGVNRGASFTATGRLDGAYYFDASSNAYIVVPASTSLNVKNTFTLSTHFKEYAYDGILQPILFWCRTSPSKSGVHLATDATGYQWGGKGTGAHLCGTDGSENKLERVVNTYNPNPNQWHHLVVTFDRTGGVAQVYVDGVLGETQAFTPFEPETRFDLYVGGDPTDPRVKFEGLLDEVRIYNRVLSYDEILELGEGEGAADTPSISFIGFSNDPKGDQDVTEFYRDETLYIRIRDVDISSSRGGLFVLLQQKGKGAMMLPMTRNEDGSYTGQTPLSIFKTGTLNVLIMSLGSRGLSKNAAITIRPPPPGIGKASKGR